MHREGDMLHCLLGAAGIDFDVAITDGVVCVG